MRLAGRREDRDNRQAGRKPSRKTGANCRQEDRHNRQAESGRKNEGYVLIINKFAFIYADHGVML